MILIGAVLLLVLVLGMFQMPKMTMPTLGGGAGGSVGKAASGVKGLNLVDSIQRHGVAGTLDTWTALTYQKGVLVGNVKVPTKAAFLSKIEITVSGDFSGTVTNGLYCTSVIRLSGNALDKAGFHRYPGPALCTGGKTAGAGACRTKPVTYSTKIGVSGGDELQIDGMMCGSDIGDLSFSVVLTFTELGRDYGIEDSDCREYDLTAKDTDVTLTALGADTLGNLTIPKKYNKLCAVQAVIAVGVGADYTGQTRAMVVCSLGGNAMGKGGFYHWLSETEQIVTTTTGGWVVSAEPDDVPMDVDVSPGDVLELHAMMIEEDPGLINVMVGVLYGSEGGGL